MAKGPEITDKVRMLIANLHKEHPKWTNKMIRNEVSSIMRQGNPSLPKGWPSKYSIDRIMPGVRERVRLSKLNPDPRDTPWTITNMAKYPIPPEALPSVLRVWVWAKDNKNYSLTIREAQWVARLYAAIEDTEALFAHSHGESYEEKNCEEAGIEDMGDPITNLWVFSTMTGQIITEEDRAEVWKLWEQSKYGMKRIYFLNPKIHFENEDDLKLPPNEHTEKEAQNERFNKAKKQE